MHDSMLSLHQCYATTHCCFLCGEITAYVSNLNLGTDFRISSHQYSQFMTFTIQGEVPANIGNEYCLHAYLEIRLLS